ncbi:MAG: dipeptide epimerase [Epsilonproteobacteria bacterium]|nr:dipeptide epimerase [Campylobacterota bacterium]
MKIERITLTKESIPLKTPFVTALRQVESVEFVRVRVVFEDGSVSFGEAPATKAITGEDLQTIANDITKLTPSLLGKDGKDALKMIHSAGIGSSAKAALDIALHVTTKPKKIELIKTDITISLDTSKKMLQDAKEAEVLGFEILKIKLGSDIAHAIEATSKIAQELPKMTLLIDANQAWSVQESLRYIDGVRGLQNIALIEQPVRADDIAGLGAITNYSPIPILADESAFTLADVQKIVQGKVADMINIKLMKCGGVSKAEEILEFAKEQGVRCMFGSMLEGPCSINAALYLAAKYRDVIKYVDLDSPMLYKEYPKELDFLFCRGSYILQPDKSNRSSNR